MLFQLFPKVFVRKTYISLGFPRENLIFLAYWTAFVPFSLGFRSEIAIGFPRENLSFLAYWTVFVPFSLGFR